MTEVNNYGLSRNIDPAVLRKMEKEGYKLEKIEDSEFFTKQQQIGMLVNLFLNRRESNLNIESKNVMIPNCFPARNEGRYFALHLITEKEFWADLKQLNRSSQTQGFNFDIESETSLFADGMIDVTDKTGDSQLDIDEAKALFGSYSEKIMETYGSTKPDNSPPNETLDKDELGQYLTEIMNYQASEIDGKKDYNDIMNQRKIKSGVFNFYMGAIDYVISRCLPEKPRSY